MVRKTIAEIIVDTIQAAGVRRVYGLVGDSLNGLADAIRAREGLAFVEVRHEENGAFAAGIDANISEGLSVCAGSCGPGSTHLLNGLYDCHRTGVPVLAIAAQVPGTEIGSSYYQETHPEQLFRECSYYCEVIAVPGQAVRVTEAAIQAALSLRGVGVIVLPADVALLEAEAPTPRVPALGHRSAIVPASDKLALAAQLLNSCEKVTILAGSGTEGAHAQLLHAAQALQAPVVHALRGKECVEPNNPFDVGMTGLWGMPAGYHALMNADAVLMLGTDFPYRQFFPENARVVQIDKRAERLGRRTRVEVGLHGTVDATLLALLPLLCQRTNDNYLRAAQQQHQEDNRHLAELATGEPGAATLHPQHVARLLSELASDDAIFLCDAGTPTIWAARYLRMNGRRRLLGSFIHGSQAGALPQAIGAQLAAPARQVIALCGDGGFARQLSELLTVRQAKLPLKIVLFNNGAAGLAAQHKQLTGASRTGTALDNPDFVRLAEAMDLRGLRVSDPAQLEGVLREALAHDGPVVVDARISREELILPPHLEAGQAGGLGLYALRALVNGRGSELVELVKANLLR